MKKKQLSDNPGSNEPVRFSDEELAEFKTLIDEKLVTANKELEHLRDLIAKNTETGDLAKLDNETEQLIAMRDRQSVFIENLNKASERIEDKTYGICKTTGNLIDKARLRAVPHATLSMEAKKGPAGPPPIELPVQPESFIQSDTILVPAEFYSSLENKCEPEQITKGKIKHLVNIEEKVYCLSGAVGTGNGKGWGSMSAYEAVPLYAYQNDKIPLTYNDHYHEVHEGKRDRGYDGLLLDYKGQKYVLVGPKKNIFPLPESKKEQPGQVETPQIRACRVCGCTQDDCRQCIEKTGSPCHWVEDDLCSACVVTEPEKVQEIEKKEEAVPAITTPASFFTIIYPLLDGIDINLKLKRINGRLTVSVFPETASVISPATLTGTPEELDEGFFSVISKPVTDAKGLKVDLENYNRSIADSKKENKPVTPKAEENKAAVKKQVTKKAAAVKPAGKKKSALKPPGKKPVKKEVKKAEPKKVEAKKTEPKISKPAAPDMFAGL